MCGWQFTTRGVVTLRVRPISARYARVPSDTAATEPSSAPSSPSLAASSSSASSAFVAVAAAVKCPWQPQLGGSARDPLLIEEDQTDPSAQAVHARRLRLRLPEEGDRDSQVGLLFEIEDTGPGTRRGAARRGVARAGERA